MAPSLIVMVGEAVVVSATHGGLYLLIHCSIAQWAHSGWVFWLNKYTQYTHWTKKPEFAHCAMGGTTLHNTRGDGEYTFMKGNDHGQWFNIAIIEICLMALCPLQLILWWYRAGTGVRYSPRQCNTQLKLPLSQSVDLQEINFTGFTNFHLNIK